MDELNITLSDLTQHVATFGIDVYPPVEIPNERTRLNTFYEEAVARHPDLFERLVVSDTEFRISREFRAHPHKVGPSLSVDTFVLTSRGPVFVFPLLLHGPVGDTGLEEAYLQRFQGVYKLFLAAVPERKILRLGLVRDLLFSTGQSPCHIMLSRESLFAGAELAGGNCLLQYRDARCNVRVRIEPAEIRKSIQLPVGTRVDQRESYALHIQLDVNNSEIRPLEDADIGTVIERATSLWPDELLEYLNRRIAP